MEEANKPTKSSDEELDIDLKATWVKIKNFFSENKENKESKSPHHPQNSENQPLKNPHHSHEHSSHEKASSEELSLDLSAAKTFFKSNAKWLIPLICILTIMTLSLYLRTMPLSLSATDNWAATTVSNYYRNGISEQINQQYPNLPDANKQALIDKEWIKFSSANKAQIESQTTQVSNQYKDQFKDENGTLYLLGIDPWFFYQKTDYVLENGFPGSEIKDGKQVDSYRLAPLGTTGDWGGWPFHYLFGAVLHRFLSFFADIPLMFSFFFVGAIFSALAVIPAFFIGKRISGNNVGGLFTSIIIAVSAFFVQRTTGESSDTDVYIVFFPLLITWLFLEAFEAKELKKKLAWILGAGIATGIFSFAWSGWWYVSDFILGTIVIYLVYLLAKNYQKAKETLLSENFKQSLYLLIIYFLTSSIIVALFSNIKTVYNGLMGPFSFMQIKAVAVDSLWPNIMTTVAELNVVPLSQVIEQLGGKLLFFLAIVGIILTFLKKDEKNQFDVKVPIFLIIWFIASLYATTKGMRFILQAIPVFAISFGAFLGISWHYASTWISKELKIDITATKIVVLILLSLLLIQPYTAGYNQAFNSIPSMNDGWYNTLLKIKTEAPQNSIITSWWDFGYWFRAVADRPVTFDGGTQVGWGAHWVGRSLLTSSEDETAGIIMMLNCGQNNAFDELDKIINDTPKEIRILHEVLLQDKEGAIKILKKEGLTSDQISTVIKYVHCDAPTDYYITSDDMVGKAGVWGHFGSWNFDKAAMYQEVSRAESSSSALQQLQTKWKLSAVDAEKVYYDVKNTPADQYVAPWPGYLSGLNACAKVSAVALACNVQSSQGTITLDINLQTINATVRGNNGERPFPTSLVYADKMGVKEKKFSGEGVGAQILPFSAVLVPQDSEGENYALILTDPLLASSTFTKLFFFDGHGMKCFSKFDEARPFTGGKIITWKVDYDCKQNNQIFFPPKEEVHAAHILVTLDNRTDEEALKLITAIRKNITTSNFAVYAKRFSEDGTAQTGGDLGWFGKGVMVKPFEDTAFNMKMGEISQPVKTQFGYHLILLKEKRTS